MFRLSCFFLWRRPRPRSPLFPYTTLFRSLATPVLGGMVSSLGLVLIVTPVIFSWLREQDLRRAERDARGRSEEHTSELQSHSDLVCRLLLEKKKLRPRRHRVRQHPHQKPH